MDLVENLHVQQAAVQQTHGSNPGGPASTCPFFDLEQPARMSHESHLGRVDHVYHRDRDCFALRKKE